MKHNNLTVISVASFSGALTLLTIFVLVLDDLLDKSPKPAGWRGPLIATGFLTIMHAGILLEVLVMMPKGTRIRQPGRFGFFIAVADWAIMITLWAGMIAAEKLGHGGPWELFAGLLIVLLVGPVLAIILVTVITQRGRAK
jgi:hypothetical protein